jgi:hypothetical protein
MSNLLPDDLVWDASHLSEIALTAIADGEEAILPADARTHLDSCEACAKKLGEAAMLSSAIGSMLRAAPARAQAAALAKTESVRPRAKMPRGAIAIGLSLAVLGAVPMMLDLPTFVSDAAFYVKYGAPVLVRGGLSFVRAGVFGPILPLLTFASACVLLVASFVLMRRLPARVSAQGVS